MANQTKSGWYLQPLKDVLIQTAYTGGNINLTLATYKICLATNTGTDGSAPLNFSTTTAKYGDIGALEVSGTGWASGGVLLSAAAAGSTSVVPTFAEGTTGSLRWNWTNPLSVASTTLANVYGCWIYADPVSAPNVKPLLIYINFGSLYSTTNGTFGITPSGTGLSEIDVTP